MRPQCKDTNSKLTSTRRSLIQSISVAGLFSYSTQLPVRAQSDEAQNTNAAIPTNPEIQTALPPTKQGDELVFNGTLVNLATKSGISNEKITLMEEDDRWGFSDNQLSEDTTDGTGDFSIRWTPKQGGILSDSYSPIYLQYNYSGNSIRYPAEQPYLVQTDPSITPLNYNTTTLSPRIVKKKAETAKFYFYVVESNGFDVLEAIPQKWDELPTISIDVDGINSNSYSLDSTEEQLLTEVLSAYTAIPIPGFN